MGRYLSWLANGALLGVCCFLVANTANTVFAALLTPAAEETAAPEPPPPPTGKSWQDRQVIVERNLFNAAKFKPPPAPPPPEDEDLEATQLPLDLLGTVASGDPELSWAAVQDRTERKHLILQVGDVVQGGKALVRRIEARRVVLAEGGKLRELALTEDHPSTPQAMRGKGRPTRRAAARTPTPRRRGVAGTSNASEGPAPGALRAAARLFSQAQILPKYENGEMIGVQVNAIQPGSTFEELGFQEGDVITEFNGIPITSPEESARVMKAFAESTEFTVTKLGQDGAEETVDMALPVDE